MQYILTQEELDELKQESVVGIDENEEETNTSRLEAIFDNSINIKQGQRQPNFTGDPFAEPEEYFTISFNTKNMDSKFITRLRSMARK